MKKVTLVVASLLLASAGCTTCGQGNRPGFFTRFYNRLHGVSNVGAPCDAGCEAVPVAHTGCDGCGGVESAAYGGYDGTVIGTYEGTPISYGTGTTTGVPTTATPARELVTPRPSR